MLPLERLTSFLAPFSCLICNDEGNMLCDNCAQTSVFQQESRCYLCNKLTKQHRTCTSCRSKSSLRRVWWLGVYEKELRLLVREMKYQRRRGYAREFGSHLAGALPFLPQQTVVMHVPTASQRIRERSYDQAALIARQFAKECQLQYLPWLWRVSQADQIGKRRLERFRQMERSLVVRDGASVKGLHVLLIDDVLTTGATLEAAARILRNSGAAHVDAAVVARHLIK